MCLLFWPGESRMKWHPLMMTTRETSEPPFLEGVDATIPFHCPKCGTSQPFLTLEALNSHIEAAHICRLPPRVNRSEVGHVGSLPILNLLTKESKLLETELVNQTKDTEENKKHESPDMKHESSDMKLESRDQITTPSSGTEGSLAMTSSSTMAHLFKMSPPPAGLYCCTSDFTLAKRGLVKSNEHLRFSSGALLCPYEVKSHSRIPHVLTSYASEALVHQAPVTSQNTSVLAIATQQELSEKQKAFEVEKQALTEELRKVRMELDALRSRAADIIESQRREIECLSEQVRMRGGGGRLNVSQSRWGEVEGDWMFLRAGEGTWRRLSVCRSRWGQVT